MASSRREKELARQRAERQAARRAAAAQRRKQRNLVLAAVAAVLLVVLAAVAIAAAVTGGDEEEVAAAAPLPTASTEPSAAPSVEPSAAASLEPSAEPSAEPSTEPSAAPSPGATGVSCTYPPAGTPAKPAAAPPTENVENELVLDVGITTNRGEIVFEMDTAQAPCTASSLRTLASVGYFDDTPCHRLTTQGISVLQCGDPTGTGTGGPGYSFANENLEGASYPRGTVAMANAGPDTNGSQFFLVYADTQLPPSYTPFGRITEGLELLDEVAAAGSDESFGAGNGRPNLPVQIERLRVTTRGT